MSEQAQQTYSVARVRTAENRWALAIDLSVCAVLLLGVLLYDDAVAFSAETPRWILLTFVAAGLPLLSLLRARSAEMPTETPSRAQWHMGLLQLAVVAYLAWCFLSWLWAIDRATIVVELIQTSAMLLLLLFFLREGGRLNLRWLVPSAVLAVFLVSAIGMLQYFGWDGDFYFQLAAPASTFINKNVATPIIPLLLPGLLLLLLFVPSTGRARILVAVLVVVLAVVLAYLVAAATRSSWVASFVVVVVMAVLFLTLRPLRQLLRSQIHWQRWAILGAAIALAVVLVTARSWQSSPARVAQPAGEHLSQLFAPLTEEQIAPNKYDSRMMRLQKYYNSLGILRDNPVLGVGLGSFDAAYPPYHEEFVHDIGFHLLGQLHNDIYQVLLELGLVGFMLFTLIYVLLAIEMLAVLRDPAATLVWRLVALASGMGVLGLLTDAVFNKSLRHPTHWLFLALLAGLVHAAYVATKPKSRLFVTISVPWSLQRWLRRGALLLFVVLTLGSVWLGYKRFYGDAYYRSHRVAYMRGELPRALEQIERSMQYWPWHNLVRLDAAMTAGDVAIRERTPAAYERALYYQRLAAESLPNHFMVMAVKAMLGKGGGRPELLLELYEEIDLFHKVIPRDAESAAAEQLAYVYEAGGELSEARRYLSIALKKFPERLYLYEIRDELDQKIAKAQ